MKFFDVNTFSHSEYTFEAYYLANVSIFRQVVQLSKLELMNTLSHEKLLELSRIGDLVFEIVKTRHRYL